MRKGRKSESEVLAEFLDSYEAHHQLVTGMRDQRVRKQEFLYYFQIVFTVDQERFTDILKGKGILGIYGK